MSDPVPETHRFSHQAMGTFFEVVIAEQEKKYAGQAAREVFVELDRIERLFSRFDPASEIARINRLRPGEGMIIGVETYDCLVLAEEVRAETDGAFDIMALTKAAHRKPGLNEPVEDEEFPALELLEAGDLFEVRVLPGTCPTFSSVAIDLGAIGKGFAIDLGLDILAEWSIENALIHGGTSTAAAAGTALDGTGWSVGIGGGWPGAPREFKLLDRALSGSGTEVKGQHILDPRTGGAAKGHLAAWAAHPSAAVSDALSTAFMIMGTDEVEAFCAGHPEAWALVIPSYGEFRVFPNERKSLR
jgi:thiamine biosynthesis lipoprotein